jgi:glyoxylate carboligase
MVNSEQATLTVRQTVGSRVADLIMQEGVNVMFTLPEVTFGDIHHRLIQSGGRIVAPHHETAAAYMAEAFAQMTGKFGVTGGNCGPGAANLLPSIVHCSQEGLRYCFWDRNAPRWPDTRSVVPCFRTLRWLKWLSP